MKDDLTPLEAFEATIHSFIVTIRVPPDQTDKPIRGWYGIAEHVQSHRRIHFRNLENLSLFIQRCAGLSEPPSSLQQHPKVGWMRRVMRRLIERLISFRTAEQRQLAS
jgi:hypothetical protein